MQDAKNQSERAEAKKDWHPTWWEKEKVKTHFDITVQRSQSCHLKCFCYFRQSIKCLCHEVCWLLVWGGSSSRHQAWSGPGVCTPASWSRRGRRWANRIPSDHIIVMIEGTSQEIIIVRLVLKTTRNNVTTLTMNNPKKLNGWSGPMMLTLRDRCVVKLRARHQLSSQILHNLVCN